MASRPKEGRPISDLSAYLTDLAARMGVDAPDGAETAALLDLARDAAHGVQRPAAPLTCYLAGLLAGARGDRQAALDTTAAALAAHLDERA